MPTYSIVLIVAAALAVAAAAALKITMAKKHPAKVCAECGRPSAHGYSKTAESGAAEIVPFCADCLMRRLDEDYSTYKGRAIVVQPVAELPCYVFRPSSYWSEAVRRDLDSILAGPKARCQSCGEQAQYAWVNALEPGPVAKLPKLGIRQTLLAGAGAHPVPLCAKCAVKRIGHSLSAQEGGYVEICGPQGSEDGVVSGLAIAISRQPSAISRQPSGNGSPLTAYSSPLTANGSQLT